MEDAKGSHERPSKPLILDYELELQPPPCVPGSATLSARASLEVNIEEVLPYLNARLEGAEYDHGAKILVWKDQGYSFAFRSREIKAAPAIDREEARSLIDRAVSLANETWQERDQIEPRYEKRAPANLMQIYRLLPRTNCGECGHATCMAFAARLLEGNTEPGRCPVLEQPGYEENRRELVELLESSGRA
jgi:ArsR family metal-binding transcriptional regulator